MTLVQASTEWPSCASCGSPRRRLGFLAVFSVLLARPTDAAASLVAEGSSRGGSSLQMEVLLSRAAITACCQLQVISISISLSSLLLVFCSSSENRSCVCLPALSCSCPAISSNTAIAPSSPLHDSKAWRTISFGVLSGCSTLQCVATFLCTLFHCISANLEADLAINYPQTLVDPAPPSVSALLTSYRPRSLVTASTSPALAQVHAVEGEQPPNKG